MVTSRWTAGWLVLVTLLKITICTSDQGMTCIVFEDGGVRPTDKQIEIQKDSYINLTVSLKEASNCQNNDQDTVHIKIFKTEKNLPDAFCKFLLNTKCQTSDSTNSTNCRCLSPHTVQFLKKANSSDSGEYRWTWNRDKTQNYQGQRDILIFVKETTTLAGSTVSDKTTGTVTGVSVGVVVMVSAGLVFLMRCRRSKDAQTCGQHHRFTKTDDAGNDHVNEEVMNQVEDTYYTEIFEPDEPTYAKVNKEAKRY